MARKILSYKKGNNLRLHMDDPANVHVNLFLQERQAKRHDPVVRGQVNGRNVHSRPARHDAKRRGRRRGSQHSGIQVRVFLCMIGAFLKVL